MLKDNSPAGIFIAAILGDTPQLRVLREMAFNPDSRYVKLQLANGARISRNAVERALPLLVEGGLVIEEPFFSSGKAMSYRLNRDNPLTIAIQAMFMEANRSPHK